MRSRLRFGNQLLYSHTNHCWYVWDGVRWLRDDDCAVKRLADQLLQKMEKELFGMHDKDTVNAHRRNVERGRSSRGKEALLKEAQHLAGIPARPDEFDRHKGLLNVVNGVITLRNGALRPHAKEDYLTRLAGVTYDKEARCPTWERFLSDITGGDASLSRYLQAMAGYLLSGSTQEQCVFFLYGDGANGKSTFIETLASLMGDYAMNTQPETIMLRDRQSTGARSDIARLKGARMVTVSETDEGARLNESMIKQMTGGEVLTARFLYGSEFEFRPEFKILMATNHKPLIRGTDAGIWRRIRLIPFVQSIPLEKQDKRLPEKLLAELPGILNWCLAGCAAWTAASKQGRSGMPPCEAVERATLSYKNEQDRLQAFVEACTQPSEGGTLQAQMFYKIYLAWAQDNGERFPVSSTKFGREMKKRFQAETNRMYTEYRNIGLTPEGRRCLNFGMFPRAQREETLREQETVYEQQRFLKQ